MINDQKTDLLAKYNNGNATPEEQAIVESWQLEFPLGDRHFLSDKEIKKDLLEIRANLLKISGKQKTFFIRYTAWVTAASIVIAVSIGIHFYNSSRSVPRSVAELAKNDIQPGTNMATLTLANGKQIILNKDAKGELAEQSGMSIIKDEDGQVVYKYDDKGSEQTAVSPKEQNTLSTAKGQQYRIELPDGTKVWLNAASSLTYSPSFSGQSERSVRLSGEAYFQVAKDREHPFIVKTGKQEVRVLGTHFNINSYADEPGIKTTLLEGSVRINRETVLKPGQQSLFSNDGSLEIQPADVSASIAWKNGKFIFRKASLETVMRQVSRWYDIDVVYESSPTSDTFNGIIDRKANLSRILKILEKGGVKFMIDGKKLIVSP